MRACGQYQLRANFALDGSTSGLLYFWSGIPAVAVDAVPAMSWGICQMMTLRQVEVIRAVMVTGTIGGAAKLLNVSAPGISRLVKYTEKSLGIRFFQRQNGRYFSTPEAQNI